MQPPGNVATLNDMEIILFAIAATVIATAGVTLTRLADMVADRTRMGEAVTGSVLLGVSTSLPGTVTSVTAAFDGHVSLAASNAIGGICAQTVFLVVADLTYRKANLEHAAADEKNLFQAALLILLLAIALVAYLTPEWTVWAIHPASLALFGAYLLGVRATLRLKGRPMWRPQETRDTRYDEPDSRFTQLNMLPLLAQVAGLVTILSIAGYAIAWSGARISAQFGISQTVVGVALTSVTTSLPELVTTLAAVRRGALQLAVGGIVGGNTFDVLFLSLSDAAYREGSIYHAMAARDAVLLVAGIVMTAILLLGLILRDRRGIGFEGLSLLAVYAGVIAFQVLLG